VQVWVNGSNIIAGDSLRDMEREWSGKGGYVKTGDGEFECWWENISEMEMGDKGVAKRHGPQIADQ
jgi:hypothetical protein